MSAALPKKRPKSVAPGPYLGYGLQPIRLCYYLLTESSDRSVSVEHTDDVAVHWSKGLMVEQTKSATGQNPISDWAVDLWKTFANWIDDINSHAINADKTQFRLYVTPKHYGHHVGILSAAKTDGEADTAVKEIEQALNSLPKRPAAYEYVKKFLNFDVKKRRKLIKQFTFESSHDDPVDALRKLLSATVNSQMVDTCCQYAIGKAKEATDELIRTGKPPLIPAGTFQIAFKAFVRKYDLSGLLASLAPAPEEAAVAKTLAEAPPFVRQLEIIDMPSDEKVRAVSDYLQASVNKTKWAETGQIVRGSLVEFDRHLVRQHGLIRLELHENLSKNQPKQLGRTLYSRCALSNATLEGREVPGHFVPGCFNDLADRREIGWHPDYKKMLGEE